LGTNLECPQEKSIVADELLDTKGLNCPLPILKAKKAMAGIKAGGTLEVLATDPGSVPDFKAFCEAGGHSLLEQTVDAGVFRFLIRRAA
jgi:tRNA 2-thiouridine synthesizing protein A